MKLLASVVFVGTLMLGACSSGSENEGSAVEIRGFRFEPQRIEVAVGETVTWTNTDNTTHTVTAGIPDAPTGGFDQELGQDEDFRQSINQAGVVPYFCSIHDSMRGEIRVS